MITNDNTATASMNTSNKRPALWCRTLSPLTSAGVTGRPFWSDQSWGACPALFLLSYTLFMQVLPTSCQQDNENTASTLPLLQIIPHHVKDSISHILFWSNIKSGFLIFTWKTQSRHCFPQSCFNIVLLWDLGEMFKNVWLFGGPAVQRSWDPRQAWTRITWQIWFSKKIVKLDNHISSRLTWIPRPATLSFCLKGVWKLSNPGKPGQLRRQVRMSPSLLQPDADNSETTNLIESWRLF